MTPIPRSTVPIYNELGVQAPPLAVQLKINVGPKQYDTIAASSNVKQSWDGVFRSPNSESSVSRSLDDSIADMTQKSDILRTYFRQATVSHGDGRQKERMISQKQALFIISENRAAWDQELPAGDALTSHHNSHHIIAAGVIYYLFKSIPKNKDVSVQDYQLRWHEYYDDVPERLLWAVLHKLLAVLNRHISQSVLGSTSVGLKNLWVPLLRLNKKRTRRVEMVRQWWREDAVAPAVDKTRRSEVLLKNEERIWQAGISVQVEELPV